MKFVTGDPGDGTQLAEVKFGETIHVQGVGVDIQEVADTQLMVLSLTGHVIATREERAAFYVLGEGVFGAMMRRIMLATGKAPTYMEAAGEEIVKEVFRGRFEQ